MTTAERCLVVVNGMLHAGLMTRSAFERAVRERRHWPRTLASHLVLGMADGRLESVAETRTAFLCHEQRLPRPEPQVVVRNESGYEFARVDFAGVEHGVFLEFDGRIKYEQLRREGESLEAFLMREKRREERICQLTGWVCIRISWSDLENPKATAIRIRRMLHSRRPVDA